MNFKEIIILLLYFLYVNITYADFTPPTDNEINLVLKKMLPKPLGEISNTLQKEAPFKIIETECKTCPNNTLKYIANSQGEKIIDLPSKFMPPLHCAFYKDRIIFSGNSQTGIITIIIDSNNLKIIDIFLHFALADNNPIFQSPSGRYLLFKKFSPRNAPDNIASDFVMIYDLKKSPKENRIYGDFNNNLKLTINNSEAGNFFYPENKNFEFSLETPYFTRVDSTEKQISLYSTGWDAKNNITVISEKSKLRDYKFIIIFEDSNRITKKIYNLKQGKLYTNENVEIKYEQNMEFFMERFEIIDNILYIYNGAENPLFNYVKFKLDSKN